MSKLFSAMNETARTENGALSYHSTENKCLDFFSKAGSARQLSSDALINLFREAASEDQEIAIRTLLWSYDVRGGAGSRSSFFQLMSYVLESKIAYKEICSIIKMIPELGRWDMLVDLLCYAIDDKTFVDNAYRDYILSVIVSGLQEKNALCAKWMPRQGAAANKIRSALHVTPKEYRVMLKEISGNTVESLMSSNRWSEINYEHVPSVAMARYAKAFQKHDAERYNAYLLSVKEGKAKINASVVFPHDVLRSKDFNSETIQAQWNALPNYMEGISENVLCMCDVSGSMDFNKVSGCLSAKDVAIGTALYVAERNTGFFKDEVLLFSGEPRLVKLTGNIMEKQRTLMHTMDPCNTDFAKAFIVLIQSAIANHVPVEEMPSTILVLSDMEFDAPVYDTTNWDYVKNLYSQSGYPMPTMVMWAITAKTDNQFPILASHHNAALISGYSPAILKNVFKGKIVSPAQLMLDTVGVDRYAYKNTITKEQKQIYSNIRGIPIITGVTSDTIAIACNSDFHVNTAVANNVTISIR